MTMMKPMTRTEYGLVPYRPRHAAAKANLLCRWGFHDLDCDNSSLCNGDHHCRRCGVNPNA